jgi:hypothetical protein
MKRATLAISILTLAVGARLTFGQGRGNGQETGNPFLDRSDTGETVHVLPLHAAIRSPRDTAPIFAPLHHQTAVYPPSYGTGLLLDHGGPEIANAGFYAIYWNSSVAFSTHASLSYGTIEAQITSFVNDFADNSDYDGSLTDDYTIVQQYGSHAPIANTLASLGVLVDNQVTKSSISDSSIQGYLASLFNAGKAPPRTDTIYGIYFPPGMRVTLQRSSSCTSFCGYHSHFTYHGMSIKYASFPYLNCRGCSLSGLSVADMLTIGTGHEIRESVTDPGDNGVNAWYDRAGYEADDKCAWHYLYQMARGGFWVQPEFSNGGTTSSTGVPFPGPGCVVANR